MEYIQPAAHFLLIDGTPHQTSWYVTGAIAQTIQKATRGKLQTTLRRINDDDTRRTRILMFRTPIEIDIANEALEIDGNDIRLVNPWYLTHE